MTQDLILRGSTPTSRRNYLLYADELAEFFGHSSEQIFGVGFAELPGPGSSAKTYGLAKFCKRLDIPCPPRGYLRYVGLLERDPHFRRNGYLQPPAGKTQLIGDRVIGEVLFLIGSEDRSDVPEHCSYPKL